MKWSKGAPKIHQPTLCQQTQRKRQRVFSDQIWRQDAPLTVFFFFFFFTVYRVQGGIHTKRVLHLCFLCKHLRHDTTAQVVQLLKKQQLISRLPVHSTALYLQFLFKHARLDFEPNGFYMQNETYLVCYLCKKSCMIILCMPYQNINLAHLTMLALMVKLENKQISIQNTPYEGEILGSHWSFRSEILNYSIRW